MSTTPSKEELSERAQLVRLFEASTEIQYPSADDLNFRHAVMCKLGLAFGMKEVKKATIEGPHLPGAQRPGGRA